MPGNQKSTRWYKLCFVPTSADSSDDSDTESVVIASSTQTQTSTWEELSPPHLAPRSEPQINWLDPPPPPPPPPLFSLPPAQSSREPRIDWYDPLPRPPPRLPTWWAVAFDIESHQQPDIYQPPNPRNAAYLDHDSVVSPPSDDDQGWPEDYVLTPSPTSLNQTSTWEEESSPPSSPLQFFSPQPSPSSLVHRINWHEPLLPPPPPPPPLQPLQAWAAAVVDQGWPADDQSECLLQVPAIRRVRITELDQRDKLSHCPICMEEFKVGEEAYQLPCNHAYRSKCILRWLSNRNTCPVCRLQLDGWERSN